MQLFLMPGRISKSVFFFVKRDLFFIWRLQYKCLADYVPLELLNHVKSPCSRNMLAYTRMNLLGIEFTGHDPIRSWHSTINFFRKKTFLKIAITIQPGGLLTESIHQVKSLVRSLSKLKTVWSYLSLFNELFAIQK